VDPPERLEAILSLARDYTIELETHPVNLEEYDFLMKGTLLRDTGRGALLTHGFLAGDRHPATSR
jgi:hypothetical protein